MNTNVAIFLNETKTTNAKIAIQYLEKHRGSLIKALEAFEADRKIDSGKSVKKEPYSTALYMSTIGENLASVSTQFYPVPISQRTNTIFMLAFRTHEEELACFKKHPYLIRSMHVSMKVEWKLRLDSLVDKIIDKAEKNEYDDDAKSIAESFASEQELQELQAEFTTTVIQAKPKDSQKHVFIVVDTNCFLRDDGITCITFLSTLPKVTIIVPYFVWLELDNLKKNSNKKVAANARRWHKHIATGTINGFVQPKQDTVALCDAEKAIMAKQGQKYDIFIVNCAVYYATNPGNIPKAYAKNPCMVVFLTYDNWCQGQAVTNSVTCIGESDIDKMFKK